MKTAFLSFRVVLAALLAAPALLTQSGTDLRRPQTPQPPFPYESREVTLQGLAGGAVLSGSLMLPRQTQRAPAVVLAPGAGAVDRDDTILGHKPLLVLADYLARNGVASLRLDSRGIGRSTGNYTQASGETLGGDLVAAVEFLAGQPEVDARRVGIIGHSQGGMVAALAATRSSRVAFLVLLAAPGLPDTELTALRIGAGGRARNLSAQEIAAVQSNFRAARQRQANGEDDPSIRSALAGAAVLLLPPGLDAPPAALEGAVGQQIAESRTPNGAYFLTHDPRRSYRNLHCSVLALNGSLDQNVPARENLDALGTALREGKAAAETVEIAGLNHFFQTAKTGSFTEIGQIEETFSPKALALITDWVRGRAGAVR